MAKNKSKDADGEADKGSGGLSLKVAIPAALALVAATAAATYFLAPKEQVAAPATAAPETAAAAAPDGPALYLPVSPALTVNFAKPSSDGRYLQVLLEVMSRERKTIELLRDNMPSVRNDLLLLLPEQDPVALRTAAGKQALQEEVLTTMRAALGREDPELAAALEAVYFTKFVIQ